MENASKALIMAGGILIGILILTLAVYLFSSFGANSREVNARVEENQLTNYNAQYTIYTNRDNTIYDVISAANLAHENIQKYQDLNEGDEYYVQVSIVVSGGLANANLQNMDTKTLQDTYLKKYTETDGNGDLIAKFECNTIDYNDFGRVSKIVFSQV